MHPVSRAIEQRTPSKLRPAVSLAVRTTDSSISDRLPGLAAEIAFWVVLSLPALILTGVSAASALGGLAGDEWQQQLIERIVEVARFALTEPTIDGLVRPVLEQLVTGGTAGVASIAFVTTLWVASRAVRVVLVTLAIVYDRKDVRPAWKDRLLGLGITFGALVVGAVLAPLLIAGPGFGDVLVDWLDNGIAADLDLSRFAELWRQAYWPTVVVAATLVIAALYHLGVPGHTAWRRDLPGAALATSVWLAGSGGLRLYGVWAAEGDTAYGPLAGPIVGLLWLWLTGFAVLLGAELNAQLDRLARERRGEVPPGAPRGEGGRARETARPIGTGAEIDLDDPQPTGRSPRDEADRSPVREPRRYEHTQPIERPRSSPSAAPDASVAPGERTATDGGTLDADDATITRPLGPRRDRS